MAKIFSKKGGEVDAVSLGTQAWNIADGYTKIKILKLLIELDLYESVSKFGRARLEELIPSELALRNRVEALDRMLFVLKQLVGNCSFAISDKKDKETIILLKKRIENIGKVIDGISFVVTNDVTKEQELRINEEHFQKCFGILQEVKDELNFPINKAGLIFRHTEDIDLDKIMKEIEEGG